MVVVGAIVGGFKVVATVEELADVSAAGSFDNEFAAWVVRSVVSSVEYEVIEKKKVTLSLSGDSVEFVFGHGGDGSPEFLELANVELMANFHDDPCTEEENDNTYVKESRSTSKSDIL